MNKKFKKTLAGILGGALVLSMVPVPESKVEAADLPTPTAHYDMSHSGSQLLDVSGNGRHATLQATEDGDFKSGGGVNLLQFEGGKTGQYAELPQGLVTANDNDFTVEITLSTSTPGNYWAWVLGQGVGKWGENNIGDYFFMGPKSAQGGYEGKILSAIKVGDESKGGEKRFAPSTGALEDEYYTVTVVSDDKKVTIYLDGTVVSSGDYGQYEGYDMSKIIPDSGTIGYIGKSLYADDSLMTANVGDIKFYDVALTAAQVKGSMPTDTQKKTMFAVQRGTALPGESSDSVLIASYDMTRSGDKLTDNSGQGNDATLYGVEDEDFLTSGGEKIWSLKGESYATLPASIMDDLGDSEDFTVQATLTTRKAAAHWLFVIGEGFGTWNAKSVGDYIFVNPSASEKSSKPLSAIKTGNGGDWKEARLSDSSKGFGDVSGYGTITLTGDGGELSLYLDGELIGSASQDKTIQDVLPDGDILGYIGMSLYEEDPLLTANLSRFEVYSGALTQDEIKQGLPTSDEKSDMLMADVLETVKGENKSLDAVTEDLSFPSSIDNVTMNWGTWDRTDIIAADGKVTGADEQVTVKIPVSWQLGGTTYNKEIEVNVLPVDTDAELEEALASIDIPNKDDVRGNITLPEKSDNGIAVKWSTDNADIVNVNSIPATVAGYDDTPAGTVTRPEKDTVVTMTASLTLNGRTVSKDIKLTVKAAPEEIKESDYTDYFFAYFAGEKYSDGEQIYFASSQDGLNWTDLNKNNPVLTSDLGEKGVRDPFIIRSPEGDKFYMIATDLKINGGNGWGAAQTNGSQSLMVWESTDLVNWSEQRMVEVSASIDAGCTWAPEATYDPLTGEYVVYWASKVAGDGYSKQRLYYAKTRDFYTFTEPQVFIDTQQSSIDTTILYEDGMYYRYTKNESDNINEFGAPGRTIYAQKSDSLLGGNWTNITTDSLKKEGGVEGPTIFKLNEDDQTATQKYCLLVDNFGGIGYYPLVTDDLSDGEFEKLTTGFKMPSRARHGTPIRVTSEEYKNIMEAYGSPDEVNVTVYAGETPKLPETVTIGGQDIQKKVTWNLDGVTFDGNPFSVVKVTGTVEGNDYEAVANVRIIPKDIEYMIDCNNTESGTWKAIKESNSSLLNSDAADQAKTEDNTWGYTSVVGTSGSADITGYSQNDVNNPYTGGWWARGGKDITYQVTLPAGEHTIYLGCKGWWSISRNMDVFYSVNGSEQTKLCDFDALADQETSASGKITLEEESVVTLTVTRTSTGQNSDPMVSWIAVSGKAAKQPIDLTTLREAVNDAKAANYAEKDYTADSWKTYSDALAYAEGVLAKGDDAEEVEVKTALDGLAFGRQGLVPANRQLLADKVAEAEKILSDGYTVESWNNLQTHIAAAITVLNNSAATPAQIQKELDELTQAIADLDKKPEGGGAIEGGGTGEGGGQTGGSGQTGNKGDGDAGNGGSGQAPQTGDSTNLLFPAATALAALAAAVVIAGKKRRA